MAQMHIQALAAIGLSLSVLMMLAWIVQQRTGNSGWVDTIWTYSVGLVSAIVAVWPLHSGLPARQALAAGLVLLWSGRLGTHIALRSLGAANDPRYASYAQEWGTAAARRMFAFLQAQALASVPLAFAVFLAARAPQPTLRIEDYVGAAIALAAIVGEAVADEQLRRFKAYPANAGRVCDVGLWRWSRHPNYFFEWLGWIAYPVIALSPAYPWSWASLAAPAIMYWILVHATGIPPLEAQMLRSRGDRYRAYQAKTSPFFPLPPQRTS
jgi:steroid 5-alpha reductase family enzyme